MGSSSTKSSPFSQCPCPRPCGCGCRRADGPSPGGRVSTGQAGVPASPRAAGETARVAGGDGIQPAAAGGPAHVGLEAWRPRPPSREQGGEATPGPRPWHGRAGCSHFLLSLDKNAFVGPSSSRSLPPRLFLPRSVRRTGGASVRSSASPSTPACTTGAHTSGSHSTRVPEPSGRIHPLWPPPGTPGGHALVQREGRGETGLGAFLSKVPSSSGNSAQDLASPAHGGGAGSPGPAARGRQVGSDVLQRGRCPLLTGLQGLDSESRPGTDHAHLRPRRYR